MKTFPLLGILCLFGALAAWAQTNRLEQARPATSPVPATSPSQGAFNAQSTNTTAAIRVAPRRYTGVVPKIRRAENPLQLINPFAPAEYGNGWDNVAIDPATGRGTGLAIVRIEF